MNENVKYLNAFNHIAEIGASGLHKIKKHFTTFQLAWQSSGKEWQNVDLPPKMINLILEKRKVINPEREYEKIEKEGILMIDFDNENYPQLLKKTSCPPAILYLKGNINLLQERTTIAIVGSRRCSDYGKQVAFDLSNKLSKIGFVIISGLAIGIDTWSHQAVLENKGQTIAVLGTGLDVKSFYPQKNLKIRQAIIENNGLIISEYPIGTKGLRQNFPHRNRIIAGLSLGVLVVEAKKDGGALITARYAVKEKRKVFAVPGQINVLNSQGPNLLIKQGAILVEDVADIITGLNLTNYLIKNQNKTGAVIENNSNEGLILTCLKEKPLHIDEIIKTVKIDTATVVSILTILEIDKKIKHFGNGVYGII